VTDQEFKIVFKLYHTELFAFIKATIGNHKKSELIAVYCFVALRLHEIDNPKKFLFDQAKYECKRYINPEGTEDWDIENIKLSFHVINSIVNAIKSLPARQVNIAVSIRYDGLTIKETASRLGITVDSVRVQFAKARRNFYTAFNYQTYLYNYSTKNYFTA